MEQKINWGISKDLQADIRYEPNACRSFVMDISLGCPHRCIYCLFSPLEIKVYKLQNPGYKGDTLPLKLDKFLAREKFPPVVYMCYSSDPLGNQELIRSTVMVLKKLFEHNIYVLFITKGIFTDEVLDAIRQRPELMQIQVGMTNYDNHRNRIVEPGAPLYEKRLENIKNLSKIKGLGSLIVRIDPLLPFIDDTVENVTKILQDVSNIEVKEAVIGYIILTKAMRNSWLRNKYTQKSAEALTEKTITISQQELYSIPLDQKVAKLSQFEEICRKYGMKMAVCGCKDEALKKTEFEWICHPFNRKRREELNWEGVNVNFNELIAHLK
jgi:DNA repair photolyase